jgi:hypothetical protein
MEWLLSRAIRLPEAAAAEEQVDAIIRPSSSSVSVIGVPAPASSSVAHIKSATSISDRVPAPLALQAADLAESIDRPIPERGATDRSVLEASLCLG